MTYRIAAGTIDGIHVTEHFGRCRQVTILEASQETDGITAVETRLLPSSAGCGAGHDPAAIAAKLDALSDCHIILMAQIGSQSEKQLIHRGFIALTFDGLLDDALLRIRKAYRSRTFQETLARICVETDERK